MKSYWIKKSGAHTELELRDAPVPQPARGEMRVRVKATSINRGDIMARIGRHGAEGGRPAGVMARARCARLARALANSKRVTA